MREARVASMRAEVNRPRAARHAGLATGRARATLALTEASNVANRLCETGRDRRSGPENDNPGAVVKITALSENGGETVLQPSHAGAPADQYFAVPPGHIASSIRVYLDTGKVPGWNEIDAVELIGTDGSRQ
jgi:hypothetical protein